MSKEELVNPQEGMQSESMISLSDNLRKLRGVIELISGYLELQCMWARTLKLTGIKYRWLLN
jgi:hypothetical protein